MFLARAERTDGGKRMVKKKLLTLAGVLAILASGACLLPPLPRHEPPPPPIRRGLDGVRRIRVEVVNSSPSHHLDPAALAQTVAEAINQRSAKTKIGAHFAKEARGEDAVLVITVLSETLEAAPVEPGTVAFLIRDSATLTRVDGAWVWQEAQAGIWVTRKVEEGYEADVWRTPGLEDSLDKTVSDKLVSRMFAER